jgi:putative transposase
VPLPPLGVLEGLPGEVVERARWWERQLVEVLTGQPPPPPAGAAPRPEDDPGRQLLRQRELAKVAELAAGGQAVGLSTLQRLRRAYEREGLWGLIDHRMARGASPTGRVDRRRLHTPAPGQVAVRP